MAKGTKQAVGQQNLFAGGTPKMRDGYYSGDKPNPNLRAFVEAHIKENPYDPAADDYDVPAFDKPIETTKATALYNMHAYWSKKPHSAIRQYIRHYTQPGDLILDSFCGSGGTALAAMIEGRHAVAIDLSPAATFITANYVRPVDIDRLMSARDRLIEDFSKSDLGSLYSTRCHISDARAVVLRTIYSSRFRCTRCLETTPLFDCPIHDVPATSGRGTKTTTVCPHCLKRGHAEELSAHSEFVDRVPVATEYRVGRRGKTLRRYNDSNRTAREYFARFDLELIRRASAMPTRHWYPDRYMLDVTDDREVAWGLLWRPYHRGMRKVEHFFTPRNLRAISGLLDRISSLDAPADVREALVFALTGVLPGLSFLNRFRPDVSFPLNYSANTLYVPPIGTEENPIPHLANKISRIAKGYKEIQAESRSGQVVVSTQDACSLDAIPANSVDFIFTDPPYGYRIQYGEMNFLWESWLRFGGSRRDNELIINECVTREQGADHWSRLFRRAMRECFRVLKPARWVALCFHDSSAGMWQSVQDIMLEIGFVPDRLDSVVAIETDYKTHKQHVAEQIAKRDLVINFRKPRLGDVTDTRIVIRDGTDTDTFKDLALQIICQALTANPGSTKDRVYDELVSRMVRAGTMEAHNFDELLAEVAERSTDAVGTARWYLKEAEETKLDAAETALEDASAQAIEAFIEEQVTKTDGEGVHYSDLFEYYLYAVNAKPRRPLADWLTDYFYKTERGTWRLPAGDEERELKTNSRASGVNRRIKRFANMLGSGVTIPGDKLPSSATLAEWIRHAKRAGLYEAGKLLFERGGIDLDKLSEATQAEVEEDYQTCVRALQRAAGGDVGTKKRRGRKKKAEPDA